MTDIFPYIMLHDDSFTRTSFLDSSNFGGGYCKIENHCQSVRRSVTVSITDQKKILSRECWLLKLSVAKKKSVPISFRRNFDLWVGTALLEAADPTGIYEHMNYMATFKTCPELQKYKKTGSDFVNNGGLDELAGLVQDACGVGDVFDKSRTE